MVFVYVYCIHRKIFERLLGLNRFKKSIWIETGSHSAAPGKGHPSAMQAP